MNSLSSLFSIFSNRVERARARADAAGSIGRAGSTARAGDAPAPARPAPPRAGFSLVLSLVVMSLMLLLVLTLVALLTLELQLTASAADQQRARLNALFAAKLALGHLQQEAGPDQRVTAQANVTIPIEVASTASVSAFHTALRKEWDDKGRHPYWTGVWDTRDMFSYSISEKMRAGEKNLARPSEKRPPAWLVSSGDFDHPIYQLTCLYDDSKRDGGNIQYPVDVIEIDKSYLYKTPWSKFTDQMASVGSPIELVSSIYKNSTNQKASTDTYPFDSKVTVARAPILSTEITAGTGSAATQIGHYAYWIGDEGVKARLNLTDPYEIDDPSVSNSKSYAKYNRLFAPVRAAGEFFKEWDAASTSSESAIKKTSREISNVLDAAGYANLAALETLRNTAATPATERNLTSTYIHAVTAVSQGVLADARHGGLKRDLSLLFELEEVDFNKTPFGDNDTMKYTNKTYNPASTLFFSVEDDNDINGRTEKQYYDYFKMRVTEGNAPKQVARPVFNVKGVNGKGRHEGDGASETRGNLLGPTWASLRNYYRLYKPIDKTRYTARNVASTTGDTYNNYSGANFLARTWEPNAFPNNGTGLKVAEGGDEGYRASQHGYLGSAFLSASMTGPDGKYNSDPHTEDEMKIGGGIPIGVPRPMAVAATPQVARVALCFGLKYDDLSDNKTVRLLVNPVVIIHNPYNVPMTFRSGGRGQYGELGMRVKIWTSNATGDDHALWISIFTNNEPKEDSENSKTWADLLQLVKGNLDSKYVGNTGIVAYLPIPQRPIEPGEYRIFSAPAGEQPWPADGVLYCGEGYNNNGGFLLEKIQGRNEGEPTTDADGNETSSGYVPLVLNDEIDGDRIDMVINRNNPTKDFYIYQRIVNHENGKELLTASEDSDAGSEHATFSSRRLNTERAHVHKRSGSLSTYYNAPPSGVHVSNLEARHIWWVGSVEFFEKYTDWKGQSFNGLAVPNSNLPLYIMTNPLGVVRGQDYMGSESHVSTSSGSKEGKSGSSPVGFRDGGNSFQFLLRTSPDGELRELIYSDGKRAFGGNQIDSSGQTHVVRASIPRSPLLSIGQYSTANLHLHDNMPLYAVGNSFTTPYVPPHQIYYMPKMTYSSQVNASGEPWDWTYYDISWLLNASLWDGYFFSTIAPDINPHIDDIKDKAPEEKKSQKEVWESFAGINGEFQALANANFSLNPFTDSNLLKTSSDKSLLKITETNERYYNGFELSASCLLQKGTFNVNTTDIRSWKTILGANVAVPVPSSATDEKGSDAKDDDKIPFPRIVPSIKKGTDMNDITSLENADFWRGFRALGSDNEAVKSLNILAEYIAKKIRAAWYLSTQYTIPMSSYTPQPGSGVTGAICRPFFSLAEFINRPVSKESKQDVRTDSKWRTNVFGVIQNAIFAADEDNAGGGKPPFNPMFANSNTKMPNTEGAGPLSEGGDSVDTTKDNMGKFPPEGVKSIPDKLIPYALGAPGTLIQSDVLQAIGSKLSVRSDTFVIRAYGDTTNESSPHKAIASAYVEMVVQRYPDYVKSCPLDQTPGKNSAGLHRGDHPHTQPEYLKSLVNKYLGRKFRIVSIRWLSANEL